MAIAAESRTSAEIIIGSLVYWIPDGTSYGTEPQESSRDNVPTFEEATGTGLCLGMISSFKWGLEYKTITKMGCDPATQRYTSIDRKILQKVKPTFSTQDVVPEAYALEHGMATIPVIGESAKPFTLASGTQRGWLYIQLLDSLRTSGEDGALAEIHLRGDLGLADSPEHLDDLAKVNYEFTATVIPEDAFKNLAIPTALTA